MRLRKWLKSLTPMKMESSTFPDSWLLWLVDLVSKKWTNKRKKVQTRTKKKAKSRNLNRKTNKRNKRSKSSSRSKKVKRVKKKRNSLLMKTKMRKIQMMLNLEDFMVEVAMTIKRSSSTKARRKSLLMIGYLTNLLEMTMATNQVMTTFSWRKRKTTSQSRRERKKAMTVTAQTKKRRKRNHNKSITRMRPQEKPLKRPGLLRSVQRERSMQRNVKRLDLKKSRGKKSNRELWKNRRRNKG